MSGKITFEWGPGKALSNKRAHDVSFEEAQSVFFDENALLIADPDHSLVEDRFILLGFSYKLRLLVVCHCEKSGERIRIISARKATKSERKQYQER